MFAFSTKREIRHFHVVVVQWRQRNEQSSVMHVDICCFANLNLLLFCCSRWLRLRRCVKLPSLMVFRMMLLLSSINPAVWAYSRKTLHECIINGSSMCKIFAEHALHVARSLEPRPNSRGLGTAGSVMTVRLSINECSHSKNQIREL